MTALDDFANHSSEIDRLIQIHGEIAGTGPGHKYGVEVLHKSAVVLLTAFWEAFCEDLAAEALEHLVSQAATADSLPSALRRKVAQSLQSEDHELSVWRLADGGWRAELRQRMSTLTEARNRKLNTPKTVQIDDLFREAIGIKTVSKAWSWNGMRVNQARDNLDKFVEVRGAIAHRGAAESSVSKDFVEDSHAFIKRLAERTHKSVNAYVSDVTGKLFAE